VADLPDKSDLYAVISAGLIAQNERTSRNPGFGLSQAGDCPRKLWYLFYDQREGQRSFEPITDGSTLMTFAIGHAVEDIVIRALRDGYNRLWPENPPRLISTLGEFRQLARELNFDYFPPGDLPDDDQCVVRWRDFTGHMDGLLVLDDRLFPIEVKSLSVTNYRTITKGGVQAGSYWYFTQMQAYMHALAWMSGRPVDATFFIGVPPNFHPTNL
jgi:hypothetical protein